MKNLLFLLLLITCSNINLIAQNYFEEFGKISRSQVEMTTCSYDSTADAVVLFDVGKSSFENDVLFQRITRIKILNEAGKKYAIVEIPIYYDGDIQERIEEVKGATYTITNGQISQISILDTKTCYEEKINKNWKVLKFAMPNVQPGSIIEYTYKLYSQYQFNLQDWKFQWSIPALYSSYEVKMIPFYEYRMILQGRDSLDEYEHHEDNSSTGRNYYGTTLNDEVYKYGLKNLPAFFDEQFITSREDDIIKIHFQLAAIQHFDGQKINIMSTWPELIKDYSNHKDFGRYISKCQNASRNILCTDSLHNKSQLQIFNYIVDFAKDNFYWDNEFSQFADKSPSEFQKDKSGNSAEINLWLIGALQQAGIESYPMVISTRAHGKIQSNYPFSNAFNSVVAYVLIDGKPTLADAIDPYCPNNRISIQHINDKGLLVDKDNIKWLSLQSPSVSNLATNIRIDSIGVEQNASLIITASDYEALLFKHKYSDNQDIILNNLRKKMYQVDDSSLKFRFSLARSKPFMYMYNIKVKSVIINGKIYLTPFLNEALSDNPLKQKTRTYPVDIIYPVRRTYNSEIIIPEGYQVKFMPVKSSFSDDLFELDYSALQTDNSINVVFTYAFKRAVYQPDEYARVKDFFDKIVKKSSEKIVLVKK